MTEGRFPKGDPPPPDTIDRTPDAQKSKKETADEPEVHAYQQSDNAEAREGANSDALGDPPPPDVEDPSV